MRYCVSITLIGVIVAVDSEKKSVKIVHTLWEKQGSIFVEAS